MAEKTKIEWCDATFNFIIGCQHATYVGADGKDHAHPGCLRCYAEADQDKRRGRVKWGANGTRSRTSDDYWRQPEKWNRDAEAAGVRARVFCASLADVFESRELAEWAEICDGYRISIRGEIQSQWRSGGGRGDWQTLRIKPDDGGYETIQLRRHPTLGEKTLKVHRLLLQAFIGDGPPGTVGRHLDGRRSNNVLWNLVYSTQADNLKDRNAHGTNIVGERNGRAKLTEKDVEKIRERLALGHSQSAIAADFGVKQVAISRIKLGQSWSLPLAEADEPIRTCVPGQIIDSKGRPLFRLPNGEYSHCPDGDSETWAPATLADLRRDLFALIDRTPWLDWILLTKRPENVRRMWPLSPSGKRDLENGNPTIGPNAERYMLFRSNAWLLTSISDQATANVMVQDLLKCRDLVPVLGVSAEPLLSPVDISPWIGCFHSFRDPNQDDHSMCAPTLDWVIAGGESGHGARPMHPDWPRSLRDQCQAAGVPFFFKQWGEWIDWRQTPRSKEFPDIVADDFGPKGGFEENKVHYWDEQTLEHAYKAGKKAAGRLLDGRTWDEFPKASVPS